MTLKVNMPTMQPESQEAGGADAPESSLHRYPYRRLSKASCIRVIEAALGDTNGEISCRLHEVDTDSSPHQATPYHCLSYTWGNPFGGQLETDPDPAVWARTHRIQVSGPGDESGYLSVTKNLFDFLQQLARRRPGDVAHIWIDAICINQDDLDERSTQVSIMSQIYLNCQAVIVWFGIEDADATVAFDILTRLDITYDDYMSRVRASISQGTAGIVLQKYYAALGLPDLSPDVFLSCGRFLQRSWLYRIWTLQESILPRSGSLWCGPLQTPLLTMAHFIDVMAYTLRSQFHPVLGKINNRGRGVATDDTINLSVTLEHIQYSRERVLLGQPFYSIDSHRGADCTDPRDKIYGLLGLLRDRRGMTVDYTKATLDVYREFASSQGPLACIITMEDPSTRVTSGLPSWVPDYHVSHIPRSWRSRGGWGAGYCAGTAAGGKIEQLETSSPLILALSGFQADIVDAVGASYDETIYGDGIMQSLDLLLDRLPLLSSDGDKIEAFWRTLIANLPGNGNRPPQADQFGPSFRALVSFLVASSLSKDATRLDSAKATIENLKHATTSPHLPDWSEIQRLTVAISDATDTSDATVESTVENMQTYLESLTRMSFMRRFFVTRNNYLGVGSHTVRKGDCVFVLKGFDYPVLLRESGNGRYTVLGEIYVRGIMFGEALEGKVFGRIEIE